MRLFIAVMLSDSMKKALVQGMHDLKKQGVAGRYVPAQNLHLTLAFLGEVQDAGPVRDVLSQLPVEKTKLSFSEFGRFQDTLWVGVKANQKFKKYVADLRKTLKDGGISCDTSKFVPHVTMIRAQKGNIKAYPTLPDAEMTVSKVSLMKSEMKDGKRIYREIFSCSCE